jgi:TetR/AcrR family transcriptional regulator
VSDRQNQILTAAIDVFGRHGYRRASMELIAEAAGMSRPAVYQYFPNKEQVFRATGARLLEQTLAAASAAGDAAGPVADRLYAVLAVKLDLSAATIAPGHRRDLVAEASTIAADLVTGFEERLIPIVEGVLTSGDLAPTEALPLRDVAMVLCAALTGIGQENSPPDVLRLRLRQLVDLTLRGLARD